MTFVRFLAHAFRLTRRVDGRATWALVALLLAQAGVVAAVGLSLRWLVDAVAVGRADQAGAAIAVGALAFGVGAVGIRVAFTLRVYLMERVDVTITDDILSTSAHIATIEHLEQPDHLDRQELLRKGSWALSTSVWSAAGAVSAAVSLLASMLLLALVHPVLIALAGLAVPPLLASRRAARIARDVEDACAEPQRHERRLHELCISAEANKELRIAGATAVLASRAEHLWRGTTRREAIGRLRGLVWQLGGWTAYTAGFLAALVVVARLVAGGRATPGDAALVVSLAIQLQGQIRLVVWNIGRVAEAGHVVEHYTWLRDYANGQPRPTRPAPTRLHDGIVLNGVRFRYPGAAADTLHGIDLRLDAGQIVALVGVNGAGKTTLVKLLTGLYRPTEGAVLVDGSPLTDVEPAAWRSVLSGVFQDFARFQFRAWECIGVGDLRWLHDRPTIDRAVGRANAGPLVRQLPRGLDTQLGRDFDGVEPSVGQWQTLALTRGFMRPDPVLVVLDEPTAALDALAEHELFSQFTDQARANAAAHGTTTVLVSHRFTTVRMADLIVVLDRGTITELGSHEELMAAGGEYADLYRLQTAAYAVGPAT